MSLSLSPPDSPSPSTYLLKHHGLGLTPILLPVVDTVACGAQGGLIQHMFAEWTNECSVSPGILLFPDPESREEFGHVPGVP